MKLVAFGGKKASGKSTASEMLVRQYGYTELSFATPLKELCSQVFDDINKENFYLPENKDSKFTIRPKFTSDRVEKLITLGRDIAAIHDSKAEDIRYAATNVVFDTPRQILQFVGTDLFRCIVSDKFWVDALRRTVSEDKCITISDMRFKDERNAIRSLGGVLILIKRDGTPGDNHPSETDFGTDQEYDFVLDNNGTLDQLRHRLFSIIERHSQR